MDIFKWLSASLLLFCFSCSKPLPALEGIDLKRWQEDKNACNGSRAAVRELMEKEKSELLALDEMQVIHLLGRPDQNELSSRNQKFFYYYLQPSGLCSINHERNPARLIIRFNAVGLAKEVMVEQ